MVECMTMQRPTWKGWAAAGVVLGVALWAENARADVASCAQASESAQSLRDEGRLKAARALFLECAAVECPGVVRSDCSRWLGEVDTRLPSVVFRVNDATGKEVTAVRIFFDNALLTERADGRSVTVDPGEHVLRFEAAEGKSEIRLVLHEGERARLLTTTLEGAPGAQPPLAPVTPPAPTAPPNRQGQEAELPSGSGSASGSGPPPTTRSIPTSVLVLGGVSVVGLVGFTYLWFSAVGEAKDLRDECAKGCTNPSAASIRRKAAFADVSLGVGVAAAVAAVGLLMLWPDERTAEPSRRSVSVAPVPGGAAMTLLGSFE
jgi:hypothetical protein